jgi:hypothetical protein
MLFAKNLTHTQLLGKAEELTYQIGEIKFHLENIRTSMKEAIYHLQKCKYHSELIVEEVNKKI